MKPYIPGTLVSAVMNILEKEYDADLGNYGMPTAIEIEAKIPLIAAAPELLEAAKFTYAVMRDHFGFLNIEEVTAFRKIEDAISKAEGK